MKHIYLNLKRFDVPVELGGVNRLAKSADWAEHIVTQIQGELKQYSKEKVDFVGYFPEMHLLSALAAKEADSPLRIGCQSVFWEDTGANFGAFTTERPAAAMVAAGCTDVIIGHVEERNKYASVLAEAGVVNPMAVNQILNRKVRTALQRNMRVLFCVGERAEEQANWEKVLREQLQTGLEGVDKDNVVIAYEPVWSIGPGRQPANKEYITKIAKFIKQETNGLEVVYGGGLKIENAKMLSSIEEIDGGLIALTRFTGEIGFYPEEYLETIKIYMEE